MNLWDQLRQHIQPRVSEESYNNWFKGTTFLGVDGDTLVVLVPDGETRAWMENEYGAQLREAIRELRLPVGQIGFETRASSGARESVNRSGVEPEQIGRAHV